MARGGLYALIGHIAVVIAAFVAGAVTKPSPGGGFEDVAAAGLAAVGGEALLGIVCLTGGAVLFRRGDRETGLGLVAGWLAGLAILVIIIQTSH